MLGLHYGHVFTLPIYLHIAAWIVLMLFFLAALGTDPQKTQVELDKLETTKRLYFNFLNIRTDEAYFDQLVIENLSEYYSLVKVHSFSLND